METTRDAFLGGRLTIRQPKRGYRTGADPVFLAAAVDAKPGQSVLELGCGAGTALACLLTRCPEVQGTGVEKDSAMAKLAVSNLSDNELKAQIVVGDVADLPKNIRAQSFDHVMMNPPFFDRNEGSAAEESTREAGRGEGAKLSTWLDTGLRRLRPGGSLTMINRIEKLPAALAAIHLRAGDIIVLPMTGRVGRPAKHFVLRAKKDANGPIKLLHPFVLHQGRHHEKDGDSYTPEASGVLRRGNLLPMKN